VRPSACRRHRPLLAAYSCRRMARPCWRLALAATRPCAGAIAAGHGCCRPIRPAPRQPAGPGRTTLLCRRSPAHLATDHAMSSARERAPMVIARARPALFGPIRLVGTPTRCPRGEPVIPMSLLRVPSYLRRRAHRDGVFAGFTSTVVGHVAVPAAGLNYTALQTAFRHAVFSLGATGASVVSGRPG